MSPPLPGPSGGMVDVAKPFRLRSRDVLGAIVSIVTLAAAVWWASRQERPRLETSAGDLAIVASAVAVYAIATFLRGWRWHAILRRAGVAHRTLDAYGLVTVGYMGNTVLPARGGELLRIVLLAGRSSATRSEALGSIVAERLLDVAALVALFAVLTWTGVAGAPTGQAPAAAAVAATALAGVAVMLYRHARRRGRMERFAARIRPLARSTRLLLGRLGLALAALTAAVWVLEGLVFWLVGQSLGIRLDLVESVFLVVLASFFALVPSAPGYLGTFDAAILFGLAALDVDGGVSIAFAVLVRFVLFVPITLVGLGLMLVRYGGLRRLRASKVTDR